MPSDTRALASSLDTLLLISGYCSPGVAGDSYLSGDTLGAPGILS